jgi:UDP-3-O-[3-hydroxymyristoyl] glucosamine N-acyltransferase
LTIENSNQEVEVGYNTVIQRGVQRNTVVSKNTIINNLCNIGHDVQIGEGCRIGLGVRVSGYAEIGAKSLITPGVTILNRVRIGRNAFVGIASLVLHDVSDNNRDVGRPAVPLDDYKKQRKAIKEMLNLDLETPPIATKKRNWSRKVKKLLYLIRSR